MTDENIRFCGRIKKNNVLEEMAAPYLTRPVGRPPKGGYEDVIELGKYQAEGWRHPQRVILVIVDKPEAKTGQLALFPRYFFLITNWTEEQRSADEVLSHYRKRGTFEDRLGEFNAVIGCRLSSSVFAENEVTLLLGLLAFNLASMLRIEFEDELGGCWDLHRFQQSVLRTGARVVKHSRRLVIYIEESVSAFGPRCLPASDRCVWPTSGHVRAELARGPTHLSHVTPMSNWFFGTEQFAIVASAFLFLSFTHPTIARPQGERGRSAHPPLPNHPVHFPPRKYSPRTNLMNNPG